MCGLWVIILSVSRACVGMFALTSAWLAVNADGLRLVLSICSLHANEMRVGLLVKAGAQGQHSLIRLIQSL